MAEHATVDDIKLSSLQRDYSDQVPLTSWLAQWATPLYDMFALVYFGVSGVKQTKWQEYSNVPYDFPVFTINNYCFM